MAAISRIMAYGVLVSCLCACGPTFVWEGVWTGERNVAVQPGTGADMLASIRKVRLTLKPNGEFELIEMGMPTSGTWRVSGKSVVLETVALMGQPLPSGAKPPPIQLARKDADTIELTEEGIANERTVVLKRVAS